jgi:poly(hydroxyalkanoate) depolymerase family esterase
MNKDFAAAMRRAALSTRAKVTTATGIIQKALRNRLARGSFDETFPGLSPPASKQHSALRPSSPNAETDQPTAEPWRLSARQGTHEDAAAIGGVQHSGSHRLRRPLGDVLRALREHRSMVDWSAELSGMSLPAGVTSSPLPIAPGAQFLTRSIVCAAGMRDYKLYIPASSERPLGLLVMLHGCKQDPGDFAAGTNMNTVAEASGLIVAYPRQSSSANASSCWNWFNPGDQMRDAGEPSIIAAITREIMSEFGLDQHQVFAAGLSAGGAMAAVMGETYSDLYAAVGIHSGLGYRSANDVVSAFAAMRGDADPTAAQPPAVVGAEPRVRTIVFHGSADQMVAPSNADRIVASAARNVSSARRLDYGRAAGGRTFTRTTMVSADGVPIVEYWLMDGGPHAWSGGHPSGSYTDPQGPDASAEMVRFFLNLPRT